MHHWLFNKKKLKKIQINPFVTPFRKNIILSNQVLFSFSLSLSLSVCVCVCVCCNNWKHKLVLIQILPSKAFLTYFYKHAGLGLIVLIKQVSHNKPTVME